MAQLHTRRQKAQRCTSCNILGKPMQVAFATKTAATLLLHKMPKSTSLSVGRGEKLPVSKGAGLTAKGRAKYNAATGSKLKPPAPNPKTKADAGRKASFCARMKGVVAKAKGPAERAKASLRRWKCS